MRQRVWYDAGFEMLKRQRDELLTSTVIYLEKADLDENELLQFLEPLSDCIRILLQYKTFFACKSELAKKLKVANETIKQKRIVAFKKAVEDGSYNDYLSKLRWTDKSNLSVAMNLKKTKEKLSEEEKKYLNIIEASIQKDLEDEAEMYGFSSIEEWKKNNAKLFCPAIVYREKSSKYMTESEIMEAGLKLEEKIKEVRASFDKRPGRRNLGDTENILEILKKIPEHHSKLEKSIQELESMLEERSKTIENYEQTEEYAFLKEQIATSKEVKSCVYSLFKPTK